MLPGGDTECINLADARFTDGGLLIVPELPGVSGEARNLGSSVLAEFADSATSTPGTFGLIGLDGDDGTIGEDVIDEATRRDILGTLACSDGGNIGMV